MKKLHVTNYVIPLLLILSALVLMRTDASARFPRQLRFPPSRQTGRTQGGFPFRPRQADDSDEDLQDDSGFSRAAQRRPVVFRARPVQEEDDGQAFFAPQAPARAPVRAFQQQPSVAARPIVPSSTPSASASRHPQASANAFGKGRGGGNVNTLQEEEEKEEESKPDRLTELLTTSKFGCRDKKLGYYADEGLGCEVFHYCADGVRHSWMCPEGQSFHQIHLICMLQGSDNICAQSQKYHFVNDYLYKPINEGTNLNETLKYHDRFFPEELAGEQVPVVQQQQQQQAPPQRHHQQQQQQRQPQFVQRAPTAFQQGFDGQQQFHAASQGRAQAPAQFDVSGLTGRLPQFVAPASSGQRQRATAQRAQTFHQGGQREDPRAFLDYEES